MTCGTDSPQRVVPTALCLPQMVWINLTEEVTRCFDKMADEEAAPHADQPANLTSTDPSTSPPSSPTPSPPPTGRKPVPTKPSAARRKFGLSAGHPKADTGGGGSGGGGGGGAPQALPTPQRLPAPSIAPSVAAPNHGHRVHRLLANFVEFIRRDFVTCTFVITLRSASNLRNADSFGKSDPYAKIRLGRHRHRSSVQKGTLDPQWGDAGEEFIFSGRLRDLLVQPLHVELFDEDVPVLGTQLSSVGLSLDDSLGYAEVETDELRSVAFEAIARGGSDASREFELPLSTQGAVRIRAEVRNVATPAWATVVRLCLAPLLEPIYAVLVTEVPQLIRSLLILLAGLPRKARTARRDATFATLVVSRMSASGLRNADASTLLDGVSILKDRVGSKSDPYLWLSVGGEERNTATIPDALDPVWSGDEFRIRLPLRLLLAGPMLLEIFDEDLLSSDDSLGTGIPDAAGFKTLKTSQIRSPARYALLLCSLLLCSSLLCSFAPCSLLLAPCSSLLCSLLLAPCSSLLAPCSSLATSFAASDSSTTRAHACRKPL